ncbi:MAG TPA: 5'-3' exonuclease H3TH domain-containing protein, partial [Candidatus Omnitrophota bacterium]|nr:5'-3' exonuclease H3TH domain-containing protein [Candidatus Omnitrophota bacterium]
PERIVDLISLMGDSSDNIPGAKGIGEKTALALLSEFKDSRDVIENADRIKRESVRKIIKENSQSICISRELACLHYDVPIDIKLPELKIRQADNEKLWELFSRLEFRGMLSELSQERLSSSKKPSLDIKKKALEPEEFLENLQKQGFSSFHINEERSNENTISVNLASDAEAVYETEDIDFLKKLFTGKALMVGHDIKHSMHIFHKYHIEVECPFFDITVAASLVESSRASRELEGLLWDFLS